MNDGRSTRKAKVLPFISRIERDRSANLQSLVEKAKLMKLEGFDSINWEESSWSITGGRLIKLTGKNTNASKFNFLYSPQLGEQPLPPNWDHAAKALFVLRFHRKHQAAPNQRNFITSVGYVAFVATELGLDLFRLTPEALDKACRLASQHYSEGVAYNIHKHIAEFAAHCDANGLCKVLLQYKYAKMKRPTSTGGINHTRLDDPSVLETKSDKLITPAVFKVIGELYQTVPKDHKYRFYILILSLLCCTGRRFSEISLIPNQKLSFDTEGKA
ncbi:MAG TPA: integrase, partial [Gammaproteobacteria bacterium]|nr:integrase [Gammaproteobacteria bacterium]